MLKYSIVKIRLGHNVLPWIHLSRHLGIELLSVLGR